MKIEYSDTAITGKSLLGKKEIPFSSIERAFLRIEEVSAKLCCGRTNFDRSFLVLITPDGEQVMEVDTPEVAKKALEVLKERRPEIQIGKP